MPVFWLLATTAWILIKSAPKGGTLADFGQSFFFVFLGQNLGQSFRGDQQFGAVEADRLENLVGRLDELRMVDHLLEGDSAEVAGAGLHVARAGLALEASLGHAHSWVAEAVSGWEAREVVDLEGLDFADCGGEDLLLRVDTELD